MAGGGLDPLTGYRNGRNGSDTDDAGVDGQSPHVPDRILRTAAPVTLGSTGWTSKGAKQFYHHIS